MAVDCVGLEAGTNVSWGGGLGMANPREIEILPFSNNPGVIAYSVIFPCLVLGPKRLDR